MTSCKAECAENSERAQTDCHGGSGVGCSWALGEEDTAARKRSISDGPEGSRCEGGWKHHPGPRGQLKHFPRSRKVQRVSENLRQSWKLGRLMGRRGNSGWKVGWGQKVEFVSRGESRKEEKKDFQQSHCVLWRSWGAFRRVWGIWPNSASRVGLAVEGSTRRQALTSGKVPFIELFCILHSCFALLFKAFRCLIINIIRCMLITLSSSE